MVLEGVGRRPSFAAALAVRAGEFRVKRWEFTADQWMLSIQEVRFDCRSSEFVVNRQRSPIDQFAVGNGFDCCLRLRSSQPAAVRRPGVQCSCDRRYCATRRIVSAACRGREAKPSSASIRRRRSPTSVPLSKPARRVSASRPASGARAPSGPQPRAQEARAGRHTVDIVDTNGPELEALAREQHLQRVKSPYHADLIAPAIRPHGEWGGQFRVNICSLQHRARQERGPAEDMGGSGRPEVEGEARHRAGGLRLARRHL